MHRTGLITVLLLAAAASEGNAHGVSFRARGFADLNYIETDRPGSQGFRTGQIVGRFTSSLTDRITLFSEVSATPQSAGFALDVERFIVRYAWRDGFRLGAGRFHAPLSYWSVAFHHGQWLQPSLGRPHMVRGGPAPVPMHFVGIWADGSLAPGSIRADWTLGIGNGRGANLGRAGDAGDVNGSRAFLASAAVSLPTPLPHRVGAALYRDRITIGETIDADERILSAFVATESETPEMIVEYARVHHDPRTGAAPATDTETGYALPAFRLPGAATAFKPYLKYDRASMPATDAVFAPLGLNLTGRAAGLRWDVAPSAAIKVEYRSERVEYSERLQSLVAQLSFTFPGFSEDPTHAAGHEGQPRAETGSGGR